jgi:hypothetical protein
MEYIILFGEVCVATLLSQLLLRWLLPKHTLSDNIKLSDKQHLLSYGIFTGVMIAIWFMLHFGIRYLI